MAVEGARSRQKQRTRKDLLRAAARLIQSGRKPALEEVAEAAMVSRATAYRYFPNIDALLLEAVLDVATPEPATLFAGTETAGPVDRVLRVDEALNEMIAANEVPLRIMLAKSLERAVGGDEDGSVPPRQNRRTALIEAALEPARPAFAPADYETLVHALALVIGTEAMVVFKDVLQLGDEDARAVRRWAIRALVESAMR